MWFSGLMYSLDHIHVVVFTRGCFVAIFQIDTQFNLATEYWTNVWHVQCADVAAALINADILMETIAANSHPTVIGNKARVSAYPLSGGQGTIRSYNLPGLKPNYEYLPLFNVVRIDWTPPTGRPSRKYMKFPVAEANQTNGTLSVEAVTQYQTDFVNVCLNTVNDLCDIHGRLFTDARVQALVGMRQLRRGSKRRLQPII